MLSLIPPTEHLLTINKYLLNKKKYLLNQINLSGDIGNLGVKLRAAILPWRLYVNRQVARN